MLGQSTVQNVAERSYARQSSVYVEWDGMLPVDMGVPRAVDGSGRTCMQTNRDAFPWIGLDLGKEYQVSYIDINFNGKLVSVLYFQEPILKMKEGTSTSMIRVRQVLVSFLCIQEPVLDVYEAQGSAIRYMPFKMVHFESLVYHQIKEWIWSNFMFVIPILYNEV